MADKITRLPSVSTPLPKKNFPFPGITGRLLRDIIPGYVIPTVVLTFDMWAFDGDNWANADDTWAVVV